MDEPHARSADRARQLIADGAHDRVAFRETLLAVPAAVRDAWLDRVLQLDEPPHDGADLPRGCVPYMPSTVDTLLHVIDHAQVGATDVFVDVGAGVGRATTLVHLLTGAAVIGIEIQSELVDAAREVARLVSSRVAHVHGDAVEITGSIVIGTVFFFYCPFSGARLERVLADLEDIAATRPIRVCCVDLPLPPCDWLTLDEPSAAAPQVAVYRSAAVVAPT